MQTPADLLRSPSPNNGANRRPLEEPLAGTSGSQGGLFSGTQAFGLPAWARSIQKGGPENLPSVPLALTTSGFPFSVMNEKHSMPQAGTSHLLLCFPGQTPRASFSPREDGRL
jgi:hypothetical protein